MKCATHAVWGDPSEAAYQRLRRGDMAEISRADALALINQQNSTEIWEAAVRDSAALRTFRRIPMGSKQRRMPVIDVLPNAGFVGETAGTRRKPTARVAGANKMLEAEENACIVSIPEKVFDDSAFGVWESVRPRIGEAVRKVVG